MPNINQRRVIDPILSTVVQGYRHPDHVGGLLFPRVPVRTAGGQILEFGQESFKLYSSARAPGAATKRIQFGYLGRPFALENHALEAPVPREHARDAAEVPGIDLGTRAVNLVMQSMSLSLESAQAVLATTAGNYDSAHKVTLSGTAQWSDKSASNPIGDISTAREAVRSTVGLYPNTLILSAAAFAQLKDHPQLTDRIKYTQSGVLTPALIGAVLDIPTVAVGGAITFSDAGVATSLWGKHAVLAYVPPVPSTMEEPSYGYTYAMEGHPLVEAPYWEPQTKSWIYGVAYERVPVLSGITSGYLITNAVA